MSQLGQLLVDATLEKKNHSFEWLINGMRVQVSVSNDTEPTEKSASPQDKELTASPKTDGNPLQDAPLLVQQMYKLFDSLDPAEHERIIKEATRLHSIVRQVFPNSTAESGFYLDGKGSALQTAFDRMDPESKNFFNLLCEHEKGMPLWPVQSNKISWEPDLVVVPLSNPNCHGYDIGYPHLHSGGGRFYYFGRPESIGNNMPSTTEAVRAPVFEEIVALLVMRSNFKQ